MKKIISTLALITLSTTAFAEEIIRADHVSPEYYTKLFENDEVLVLKMVLKPGDADTPHGHMNETVYFEKGGELTIVENGKPFVTKVEDGQVMWHKAWNHQVTNTGTTDVVAIIVENKLSLKSN